MTENLTYDAETQTLTVELTETSERTQSKESLISQRNELALQLAEIDTYLALISEMEQDEI